MCVYGISRFLTDNRMLCGFYSASTSCDFVRVFAFNSPAQLTFTFLRRVVVINERTNPNAGHCDMRRDSGANTIEN